MSGHPSTGKHGAKQSTPYPGRFYMKSVSRSLRFSCMDMHGDSKICGRMAVGYAKLVAKDRIGPFGFIYYGTVTIYNETRVAVS